MSATAIPEALEEVLTEMAGAINPATEKRWQLRELAAWLLAEHGVECSHSAVSRVVLKHRRARAALAREALRERLLESLSTDFDALDDMSAGLRELAEVHRDVKNPKAFVACVGEMRKIAAVKAHIAVGTDSEDKINLSGSAGGLAEFLSTAFGIEPAGPVEK